VEFEWDERKNQLNKAKHGFDFAAAEKFFSSPVFERVDNRKDYGETRLIAFGEYHGQVLVVAFTIRRATVYRIISMRKANKNEQTTYRALQQKHERQD
jgi:uncharacterized protein